jgi:hypothetical protein
MNFDQKHISVPLSPRKKGASRAKLCGELTRPKINLQLSLQYLVCLFNKDTQPRIGLTAKIRHTHAMNIIKQYSIPCHTIRIKVRPMTNSITKNLGLNRRPTNAENRFLKI